MLQVGDAVMFDPTVKNPYVEYFGGNIGIVKRSTINSDGKNIVSVVWIVPVLYFGRYTGISSFKASYFTKCENHGR